MKFYSTSGNPNRNSIIDEGSEPLWSKPSPIFSPDLVLAPLPSFPQLEPFDNNIRYLAPIRDGRWTIRGVDLARELESGLTKLPSSCTSVTSCSAVLGVGLSREEGLRHHTEKFLL